ncbi:MAG: hypothetical protein LBM92_07800 [Opitutaceae bacterium]|jgi:hypothetical protein|nr:hypothetical protein [Opitutaceae bacterium]
MNLPNAIGLLVLGVFMRALPVIAPAWVPVEASIGTSARELWLILTGCVIGGTGAILLLREGARKSGVLWSKAGEWLRALAGARAEGLASRAGAPQDAGARA